MPVFTTANIPGKVLVWREVLSEGPAVASLPEQEFWQQRQAYITATYLESPEGYQEKVLQELPKLRASGGMFEVVLWFDADLMCQVNLLYLLHHLSRQHPKIISICTPPPGQSIGLMKPKELQQLFENRLQLSDSQQKQAHAIWLLYASPDPLELQRYLTENIILLPHLQQALHLHLRRFPDCGNGLNYPERVLLELLQTERFTKEELLKKFWETESGNGYGYGDSQLEHILQRLQPAIDQEENHLTISTVGKQLLQGKKALVPESKWLGGVLIKPADFYCFDDKSQLLQKS
ncbi:hypothetical protein GCM10023188_11670 [Pontibacter saemangeumensis]|uniref:DUF1835 domain-containing protein n=2 Tax=Pontibacter saemangeumensis TaxID=1084525 RepID=A0ABP8LE33_9BACT